MLKTTAKKRNHLYEERALQFRSSHRSNCGVNAPFIFNNSSLWRKELSQNQVIMEVIELVEFRYN
jgi:hypothetical protein